MVKGHKKRDKCNMAGGKLSKLIITCPRGGPCSEPEQYKQGMSCKSCPKMRGMSW